MTEKLDFEIEEMASFIKEHMGLPKGTEYENIKMRVTAAEVFIANKLKQVCQAVDEVYDVIRVINLTISNINKANNMLIEKIEKLEQKK